MLPRIPLLALLVACGAPQQQPAPLPAVAVDASVTPAAPSDASAPVSTAWIEDDFPTALATARKRNAPLFVDASAVWCHTCKAMRAFVLEDRSLPNDGFVRFSFDVEKDTNATASTAFPTHVLPTFFVVDPADGSIQGRWEGAASVQQMRSFMNDGARSIALAHSGDLKPDDPLAMLLAGERAALANNPADSEKQFAKALAAAPADWAHAPEALLGLLKAKRHAGTGCLDVAESALGSSRLGATSVMADFAAEALDCAGGQEPRAVNVRKLVAEKVAALAQDTSAPLSPDDRGDAWKIVWDARESLGDHPGALDAAKARLDVLLKAVAAHPDPEIATTFDGARMETLEFLGRGPEAAAFLEQQEKALPDDYNPPHRLAHVYFKLGKNAEALEAINRALVKGYGARKGLMLRLKADILLAMGRKADARATLEQQLALYRALPDGQKKPGFEKTVQEQIDKLK